MSRLRPWHITLIAHMAYLGLVLAASGGDPIAFVRLGFGPNDGYDGQFTFLIALDPSPAAVVREIETVRADVPAYRYQRILLPMLARLGGLGQAGLIVWAIPMINLLAQTVGVRLVEVLLHQLKVSRWYALVYGLWPGLAVAVRADLTEPLSYALVAASYLALMGHRPWLAALLMGLGVFAKETALLFAGAQLLYALGNRHWQLAAWLAALCLLPFAAWQLALRVVFGSFGIGSGGYLGTPFEFVPYNGVWRIAQEDALVFLIFILFLGPWIIFPSIWGIIAAARALLKRDWHPYAWALGLNAAVIPFTPFSTFREPIAILRFATGLVLCTLLFAGLTKSRRALNYSWFWLAMLVFLIKD